MTMTDATLLLLLRAISLVETGGNAAAVGRDGERGAFQMTPAVVAESGGYSERHALRHARRIVSDLEHSNIDPLPYNIALAWNAGIGAVQRGKATMRSYEYATRVEMVYNTLSRVPVPDEAAIGQAQVGIKSVQWADTPAARETALVVGPRHGESGLMLARLSDQNATAGSGNLSK